MKKLLALLTCIITMCCFAGTVGLPTERLSIPRVSTGSFLVVVYDWDAKAWLRPHEEYDRSGVIEFDVPAWNKWYWIGIWQQSGGYYVYGKWIGHFVVE